MLSWPFGPKTCLYPSIFPPEAHNQFRNTPFGSGQQTSQTVLIFTPFNPGLKSSCPLGTKNHPIAFKFLSPNPQRLDIR
jgi:hypothetical protein